MRSYLEGIAITSIGSQGVWDTKMPIDRVKIVFAADWDLEEEPEKCPDCGSEDLSRETSGPLMNWFECLECEIWIPQFNREAS
ncbi:MAG TPA: hypothetical protein DF383_11240 [Deltaproteobacteria bacterium]|nr:hypothetical protein [Deltaproteobacteria bacterium]